LTYEIPTGVRAALFDIDGTLTAGGEVWGPLVKSPNVPSLRKAWLYVTAIPHYGLSKAGVVSQAGFRDRWVRLMAWLMTGWPYSQVQALCRDIVHDHLMPALRPDVVDILKRHNAAGHPVILVSTMFGEIVGGLAEQVGADARLGSELEIQNGVCTGRIEGQTCSGARKVDFAERYLKQRLPDLSLAVCAAYADSASDIPFLSGAGYPVAVYPDPAMRRAASERGWPVYEG
jgi:HAD superfamily hydrolase (TIGR01490 family)